jgi:hypothetical protein
VTGAFNGSLKSASATDLGAAVIRKVYGEKKRFAEIACP